MKTYFQSLKIPDETEEFFWLFKNDPMHKASQTKVYASNYPFLFFNRFAARPTLEFEPITILYGSNGSGKSTLLNVIAELLHLTRHAPYNKTDFFDDYCALCRMEASVIPQESKIITSDDIFRKMNAVRATNLQRNAVRGAVRDERSELREQAKEDPELLRFTGLEDYDKWNRFFEATNQSTSEYISRRAERNLRAGSNGETAMQYLTEEIEQNALYLLDEPENSLAPRLQLELKQFLEESARFFGCQFIIATHSPLLLAMNGAKIYNLDDVYADPCEWTELENVKVYASFFKQHANEFAEK